MQHAGDAEAVAMVMDGGGVARGPDFQDKRLPWRGAIGTANAHPNVALLGGTALETPACLSLHGHEQHSVLPNPLQA